ncbi:MULTISPECIES: ROK family protein [Microbacterium]|uniref:ROK family protein n=1 Tax=Microbacterium aurugineum TaxID=2851642 RepID=A0ABY4IXZ7_9MICO|nr:MULTISPECIES: ROK family protein [Microbacterium]MCZ4302869.1 ROK family protein [Microbacterium oxydans]PKQ36006.1 MAG: ROK family protein [Actinobacteria bacterium HGW-Actinobacteria-11]TCJ22125.1 ROK family protein [Microbacterium sp. PI-1]UPL16343.1 ROK family protein [Microbacterium aurugineum]
MTEVSADLGTGRASVGAVLDFAWTAGEFTATEAMAGTSLTRSTAIDAIDTLVGAAVLCELPNARAVGAYRSGRPSRRFVLAPDLGVVIGVDAGDTHLAVTVADPLDRTLVHHRLEFTPSQSADERRATILERLGDALTEAEVTPDRVLALCVGVAAPVNRDGVSPPHPDGFWERTNPGLAEALRDWAPVVQIKNDAQLAAIAEGTEGAAIGCRDYVALLASERFGGGVVVDGHVLHGAHGGVGEGVVFDHIVGVGSAFGLRYAVEDQVRAAVDEGEIAADSAVGRLVAADRIDPRLVLTLAASGDPDAELVTSRVGATVARIVGVLGSMYDPARVIVCGAVAESIEPVLTAARRILPEELHLPAPEILASTLGAEVVSRGAVATARRAAREYAVPRLAEERLRASA